MAYDYVNGVSYPRVTVFNIVTMAQTEIINLDLCNSNGLTEDYIENFKRNETEAGRLIDFDNKACRIIFTLDYSEYIKKNNSFNIEKIFFYNSLPDTYKLIFTPRVDVLKRYFEVRLFDGAYSFGAVKGGLNSPGNRLPIIKFITKYTVGKNFIDPADVVVPLPFYVNT